MSDVINIPPELAFSEIDPDIGDNVVADTSNGILTFTSSDSSVIITGNDLTDTIDITATAASIGAPSLVNPSTDGGIVRFSNTVGGQQNSNIMIDDNDLLLHPVEGDQFLLSQDASPFRTGSWSVTTSGALHTLLGDLSMYYQTHNAPIDANGDFLTRDEDADHSQLMAWTEGGKQLYYNTTNTTGVPVWDKKWEFDLVNGIINSGLNTFNIQSEIVDGASAVGFNLSTVNPMSTDGAKILSVSNNGSELFYVGLDNGNDGVWANRLAIGSTASIDANSGFSYHDTMTVTTNTPSGQGMVNIAGALNFSSAIRRAAAFSVDVLSQGASVLPFPSGMLFQISNDSSTSWGANPGKWGDEPTLIASRWKSEVGSLTFGNWVNNITAGSPLFLGAIPSGFYNQFAANSYSALYNTPSVHGLYIWPQHGSTIGAGIRIKTCSHVGVLLDGNTSADSVVFGSSQSSGMYYDGTDQVYNSRLAGIGNHSFTGGSIQAVDGSGAECAYGYTSEVNTGHFLSGAGSLITNVLGKTAAHFQETTSGTYANVALGGSASLNDSYPLIVARTQSAATYLNIANNSTNLSARTAFLASNGIYQTQFGQFGTGPVTTPAYYKAGFIEQGTSNLSFNFISKVAGQSFDFYLGSRTASGLNVSITDNVLETFKGRVINTETITVVSTTIDATYQVLFLDASSNAVTINLPAAASHTGQVYEFICVDDTNTVTIDPNGSETISGSSTITLMSNESITIISDGSNWWVKG